VRRRFRGLTGRLFSATARRMLRLSVRDTQCGFKMFRGDAGREIFSLVRERRFLFDLEALVLADRLGLKTVEVPISWQEIPGGHFHLVRELPRIALGLWQLRRRLLGTPLSHRERGRG
jgi:dolichyl-phosphate beta-glucosyltransferase